MNIKFRIYCTIFAALSALPAHADIVDTDNLQAGTSTTNKARIGNVSGLGAGFSGMSASSASDYSFLMDGTNTYVNAPSSSGYLYVRVANNNVAFYTSTWATIGLSGYYLYDYATDYHYGSSYFENSTFFYANSYFYDPVNIYATGGNVPHACRTTYATGSGSTGISCSTGEIATGGGGWCSTGGLAYSYPSPFSGSNASSWWVGCNSGGASVDAMIVCCQY